MRGVFHFILEEHTHEQYRFVDRDRGLVTRVETVSACATASWHKYVGVKRLALLHRLANLALGN